MTGRHRCGDRVTIGYVTKMSFLPPERFERLAKRLVDAGVAVAELAMPLCAYKRGRRTFAREAARLPQSR